MIVTASSLADIYPVFLGISKGYFRDLGLNVSFVATGGGAAALAAVNQGSVQIANTAVSSMMANVENGFPVKFIAPADIVQYPSGTAIGQFIPGTSIHMDIVMSSSNIHSYKDLPGKTVAIIVVGTAQQQFTDAIMAYYKANGSANYVAVPGANLLTSLQQGRIDVAELYEPFIAQALIANETGSTKGMFRVIGDDFNFGPPGSLITGYYSTNAWANANPDAVCKFNAGLAKAIATIKGNATATRQFFVDTLKYDNATAARITILNYVNGPVPSSYLQGEINAALRDKALSNAGDDATQIVDQRFFPLN